MRYHFVVNGYAGDVRTQMEEQKGFAQTYLAEMEPGAAFVYCKDAQQMRRLQARHAGEAVLICAAEYVPEIILDVLCRMADPQELYIFGSDDSGIELAVRMAERLGGSSVAEAQKLRTVQEYGECGGFGFHTAVYADKMVYANHMEASFVMERGPYCISPARGGQRQELKPEPFMIKKEIVCGDRAGYILSQEFYEETEQDDLGQAEVILAAGRGVQSRKNMQAVEEAARCLGAEVGVSRPAAMNAWEPMNRLIGVSGVMAGPRVCITAGISGAAAFYAGIEKSGFIAAINTDASAPIMKMADAAIVDDFLPVLEELKKLCENESSKS